METETGVYIMTNYELKLNDRLGSGIMASRKEKRLPWTGLAITGATTLGFSVYNIYALFEESAVVDQEMSWADGIVGPITMLITSYLYMQKRKIISSSEYEAKDQITNLSALEIAMLFGPALLVAAPNFVLINQVIEALGADYIYLQLAKHVFYIISTLASVAITIGLQKLEEKEIRSWIIMDEDMKLISSEMSSGMANTNRALLKRVATKNGIAAGHDHNAYNVIIMLNRIKEHLNRFAYEVLKKKHEVVRLHGETELDKKILEQMGQFVKSTDTYILLHNNGDKNCELDVETFEVVLYMALLQGKPLLIEFFLTEEMLDVIIQINRDYALYAKENAAAKIQAVKYCFGDNNVDYDNRENNILVPRIGTDGQASIIAQKQLNYVNAPEDKKREKFSYKDSVLGVPTIEKEKWPVIDHYSTKGVISPDKLTEPLVKVIKYMGTHVIPVNVVRKDGKVVDVQCNIGEGRASGKLGQLQRDAIQGVFNNVINGVYNGLDKKIKENSI